MLYRESDEFSLKTQALEPLRVGDRVGWVRMYACVHAYIFDSVPQSLDVIDYLCSCSPSFSSQWRPRSSAKLSRTYATHFLKAELPTKPVLSFASPRWNGSLGQAFSSLISNTTSTSSRSS